MNDSAWYFAVKDAEDYQGNHAKLQEIHGCVLWENREWVRSLAKPSGASSSKRDG